MVLTFVDYEMRDDGIRLHFNAADPGPGLPNDYYVLATDAELSATTTQAQLRTLVTTKLQRKLQANGAAVKLDPFKGQTVTI